MLSTFILPDILPHCSCLGDRKILQDAWGLVPDGVRVLLVEAESKLMELKYRGARAGGASSEGAAAAKHGATSPCTMLESKRWAEEGRAARWAEEAQGRDEREGAGPR